MQLPGDIDGRPEIRAREPVTAVTGGQTDLVVQIPSPQFLMLRNHIERCGKAIPPLVPDDIVFDGMQLLVTTLKTRRIDPFLRRIDIQRESPVPRKLGAPETFDRGEILLYILETCR